MRYSRRYLHLGHLLDHKRFERLFIIRIVLILFVILYISSALIYTAEHSINPQINNFEDALYFSIISVTTVGYGDVVPLTQSGKWISMIVILSGVILIPWHLGVLMKFLVENSKKDRVICKSCGLSFHDRDAVHCKACGSKIYQKYDGIA